jgi:hypothetical protein
MDICRHIDPEFRQLDDGRFAACHLLNDDNHQNAENGA